MKKILLAEDDRGFSRSMDIWLTLEGFQVVSVYNGAEALNKLIHQQYDLLITDICLPQINGLDLISKLQDRSRNLPIMVISGNMNANLISNLHKMKIFHILPKPIKPMEFRNIIGQMLPDCLYA